MNVEIGTEAAQFPEKEYINGIAFAVYTTATLFSSWSLNNCLMTTFTVVIRLGY